MRIVAVADTHMNHVNMSIPGGDVFIHAGDLSQRGSLVELEEIRDWFRSLPHQHKVFVAGNHDFAFEQNATAARKLFKGVAHYLEGDEMTVAGLRIWGGPWQPWFHSWAFNVERGKAIDAYWQKIPSGLDILITHGPPLGFGDRTWSGERVGCADLLRRIKQKQPREHLFGHIHEDPGTWQLGDPESSEGTMLRNVTVAECALPATVFNIEPR
jgi:Icc-related predicted phosphoesterase